MERTGPPLPSPTLPPRDRLLEAMAVSVRERGFRKTTLADVVGEARVSRRTFYEHFDNALDCYITLLEQVGEQLSAAIVDAVGRPGTAAERLDRAVRSYLDQLERDPRLMRSFLRELHVMGDRGEALLLRVNTRVGTTMHELVEEARASEPALGLDPLPVPMARMLATGIAQAAIMAQDEQQPMEEVRTVAVALLGRAAGGVLRRP